MLTCLPCEPGFKSYQKLDSPNDCQECLEQEQCFGTNMTAPKSEYWRSSPTSDNYMKCFNPGACLKGSRDFPLGECLTGYSGFMCATCKGRYRRSISFHCEECPDPTDNLLLSFLYLIVLISAIVLLVKVTIQGTHWQRPLSSGYIKICLNHLQLLHVIQSIKFGWPDIIQEILRYQQYLIMIPTQIISFDCFMIDFVVG